MRRLGPLFWHAMLQLCAAVNVDIGFPRGIMGLFGWGMHPHASGSASARFLSVEATGTDEVIADRRDDLRAQFEVLNTDRYDRLLLLAQRKRELAAQSMAAARRSRDGDSEVRHESEMGKGEDLVFQEYNMKRAALLLAEADKLEHEAAWIKSLMEATPLSAPSGAESSVAECEILKIGPLTFVPDPDELLRNSSSNMAQVTGSALTIYHNQVLKNTFFWEGVDLPVKATEDSPNCFAFNYRGAEQVLCAPSQTARDSWIDGETLRVQEAPQTSCLVKRVLLALSEAWFCRHMGLKGTLPSIKAAEKEALLEAFPPPPPPKTPESETNAAVNVDFSLDENKQFRVKVNGREQPVGEHIVFDVQKFAKEAAQQSDEPAIAKAALQISEKAQKVTSIAKTAASSEHQEEVGAEEELDQSKEAGEENDVEGDKTNDTEKGDADEENSLGPEEFDAF